MDKFYGRAVVSPQEMQRLEKIALENGASEEQFIQKAGLAIFNIVQKFIEKNHLSKKVTILCGKGNNGADALASALHFLKNKFEVKVFTIFPKQELSLLCAKFYKTFIKEGGVVEIAEMLSFPNEGIILDGIFGIGFLGKLEGTALKAVLKANKTALPIVAIDIPSGLNGQSGEIGGGAIKAALTIFMDLPKRGFFLNEGWNQIGKLERGDFGLKEDIIKQAKSDFWLLNEEPLPSFLPEIKRGRHKYQAGAVMGIGGSTGMCGAIKLSGLAALRSGAGLVHLFAPETTEAEMGSVPYELVKSYYKCTEVDKIINALEKFKAVFIGPGMGRTKEVEEFLQKLLPYIKKPLVIDADGLFFLASNLLTPLPEKTILTPHKKELLRLLGMEKEENDFFYKTQQLCEKLNVVIVLKGGPNFIFQKGFQPLIIPRGDPGMATAGTGDVLTGIIAALLAQGTSEEVAAILGTYIHALAGESASKEKSPYSVIASDLIQALPAIFKRLLHSF